MKKLYIALSFAAISSSIYAQNNDTKSAYKLFARYEYVKAANAYLKLIENDKADGYVYKQLADSYYNMFNTTEAVKWYAKAMETNQDAETYFRYSQMLKANGKYEESNKVIQNLQQHILTIYVQNHLKKIQIIFAEIIKKISRIYSKCFSDKF